ncbi:MAG: hypothetical protein SFZ03_02645 [Candidatus Melainabacteria bacterium]|nr:hypothetical protein [Candidatus Melainabacteria bacterium]
MPGNTYTGTNDIRWRGRDLQDWYNRAQEDPNAKRLTEQNGPFRGEGFAVTQGGREYHIYRNQGDRNTFTVYDPKTGQFDVHRFGYSLFNEGAGGNNTSLAFEGQVKDNQIASVNLPQGVERSVFSDALREVPRDSKVTEVDQTQASVNTGDGTGANEITATKVNGANVVLNYNNEGHDSRTARTVRIGEHDASAIGDNIIMTREVDGVRTTEIYRRNNGTYTVYQDRGDGAQVLQQGKWDAASYQESTPEIDTTEASVQSSGVSGTATVPTPTAEIKITSATDASGNEVKTGKALEVGASQAERPPEVQPASANAQPQATTNPEETED